MSVLHARKLLPKPVSLGARRPLPRLLRTPPQMTLRALSLTSLSLTVSTQTKFKLRTYTVLFLLRLPAPGATKPNIVWILADGSFSTFAFPAPQPRRAVPLWRGGRWRGADTAALSSSLLSVFACRS